MSEEDVAVTAERPKQTIVESFTNVSAVSSSRVDAPSLLFYSPIEPFFTFSSNPSSLFLLSLLIAMQTFRCWPLDDRRRLRINVPAFLR